MVAFHNAKFHVIEPRIFYFELRKKMFRRWAGIRSQAIELIQSVVRLGRLVVMRMTLCLEYVVGVFSCGMEKIQRIDRIFEATPWSINQRKETVKMPVIVVEYERRK